ncbi:hypothetical protein RHGRI_024382 [Rhododendron griersonianum]|uniref:Uncharacterized protein n=1 Tax=Rhododendron griersonianum TaxID=479676 RepID=A0AAV6JEF5_9ERIC|nr:hypothetical protein RHGRI_024382 [Rhododendron griersonianum]
MDDDDSNYGLHSTPSDYSDHRPPPPQMPTPDQLLSPLNYQAFASPLFGSSSSSDYIFSASSALTHVDPSTVLSQIQPDDAVSASIRAKISAHPLYPKLLQAFIDCQKETYCDVMIKYKSDLAKPFDEATTFLNSVEAQLTSLCGGASGSYVSDEAAWSSEDDFSAGDTGTHECNQKSEDRELKDKLLHKYSGYITSLKHEFSKKTKKGKLPREARQMLLDWWTMHYKWPYPTRKLCHVWDLRLLFIVTQEADKVALAELTGLDQKQINNWFINQRKRHWKPSENMQFAVMDSLYGPFFIRD